MTAEPREARLGFDYEPGIDGLRALAVGAVLVFHGGFAVASGGFLGVSLFFTLSGFLITRLLLAEHAATGRVAPFEFWARRLRRLAPGALACLLLVIGLAPWLVDEAQRSAARIDLWAALTHWANWRFITTDASYTDLFAAPSPVQHFWSLAIEEQFYLVFPIVAAGALRVGRRAFAAAVASLLAVSVLATLLSGSRDLVYYGTHTRAAELLLGALAALLTVRVDLVRVASARVMGWCGGAALVALCVLATTVDVATPWLYDGGLVGIALLSATVVVATTVPGPLRSFLGLRPLAAIGRVSYGLYLFHWPVFQLLDEERTGTTGLRLFAVRLAVTGAIAVGSYRIVERPIRFRRRLLEPTTAPVVLVTTMAIVAFAAVPLPVAHDRTVTILAGGATDFGAAEPVRVAATPPTAVEPLRVGVVSGDLTVVPTLASLHGVDVVDLRPGCAVVSCGGEVGGGSPSVEGLDLVAVVLSHADRATVVDLEGDDEVLRYIELADELVAVVTRIAESGVPVLLTDTAPHDFLALRMEVLDLASERVTHVRSFALASAVDAQRGIVSGALPAHGGRVGVFVIGDSTSYVAAAALDAAASGQMHILFAGEPNCPLVAVDRLRWWNGNEFERHECPDIAHWRGLVESFRPDAVLVVSSFVEQTELRLAGSDRWVVAGDDAFVRAHDEVMAELVGVANAHGAAVVVADAPRFGPGVFARSPMARTDRIDAWNAQIAAWDERWPNVATLPLAAILTELEADGSIRPDGVHVADDARVRLGERLAPELLRIVAALRRPTPLTTE
ncbi:MAG TPA: acyltransferase [Acidimicrobiia bacterium]|nr:acyltransferase [Acidimicrobiia bacterium]